MTSYVASLAAAVVVVVAGPAYSESIPSLTIPCILSPDTGGYIKPAGAEIKIASHVLIEVAIARQGITRRG